VQVDCSLLISEVKLAPALVLASSYTSQEIESFSRMSAPVPNGERLPSPGRREMEIEKKYVAAAIMHGIVRKF